MAGSQLGDTGAAEQVDGLLGDLRPGRRYQVRRTVRPYLWTFTPGQLAPARRRPYLIVDHLDVLLRYFSTKSRAYSTTLGDLRQARIDWTRARLSYDPETTFVLGHWQYAGQGFTRGESALAVSFAPEVRHG